MIMSAFYAALNTVLTWLMSIRPNWLPDQPPGVQQLVTQCVAWDWVFPVHEFCIVMGLFVTYVACLNGAKWAVKLVDWIADVIP